MFSFFSKCQLKDYIYREIEKNNWLNWKCTAVKQGSFVSPRKVNMSERQRCVCTMCWGGSGRGVNGSVRGSLWTVWWGAIGFHPWSWCPASGWAPGWRTSPCGCSRRWPGGRRTGSAGSWGPSPWPGCSRPSWWWSHCQTGRKPEHTTYSSLKVALTQIQDVL